MKDTLKSTIEIADIHAARLTMALSHMKKLLPFQEETMAQLDDKSLGFLELLTGRFAKLQDLIGGKLFPLYLKMQQEDISNNSFLDNLHKLEKINILPNDEYWIKMREIRNHVTHEYPDNPALAAENLNNVIHYAHDLLQFWEAFKKKLAELTLQLETPK